MSSEQLTPEQVLDEYTVAGAFMPKPEDEETPLRTCIRLYEALAASQQALEDVAEAAYWLDHLNHGVGKAGGPPEQGEWDDAYDALHDALDRLNERTD